ncbi:phytanoyl-CoA dioxygenase family protein [Planctomicrobium sp. SH668]|uniref:phytanoyl-CoA dioxygenase family protein n=1 Tax=Planctomicrobium sp. SH668 TaxID=3448126 RepID=UPI003F5AF482
MFHEQGYSIVRNACPPELVEQMLAVTRSDVDRLVEPIELEAELNYPGAPASVDAKGGKTVRRLKQALSRNIVFTDWVQHPPVVTRLKQLFGTDVVCPLAHHNCIMTKEPRFSSDTGWHQDVRYWSFTRPDLISVWLALGQEHKENGCLQLIPGSHRKAFPASSFDQDLFYRSDLPENQVEIQNRVLAELNAGDVLFFHAKTLHAATRNFSEQTKYSVVFTFRSIDNSPVQGSRSAKSPELLIHVD